MLTLFRRKAKPALPLSPTYPVNLRPILARALNRNAPGVMSPEVQRLLELLGNGRAENPAE